MKPKALSFLFASLVSPAFSQSISINFGSNETNGSINTGSSLTAGAIPIQGLYWNNASGNIQNTPQGLNDSNGVSSGAAVTWSSQNTWRSGSSGATGTSLNGALTKGYLDDGGARANITVTNVPYLTYNVYFIGATDVTGATKFTSPQINGLNYTYSGGATVAGTASWGTAAFSTADSLAEGASYLKVADQIAPTLTVQGGGNVGGSRGSVAGIQVENSYTGTLSYWDLDGATAGAGGASPGGNWADANWSAAVNGDAATGNWASGRAAVFAAGTGATGSYTVNLSGTESADAVWVQEGAVTLSGGGLNLGTSGILRVDGSGPLTLSTTLGGGSVKVGGAVVLNGANTYTGSTTISSGTLTANGGAAIPDGSAVAVAAGSSLALGASETIGALAGGGTVALGSNALTVTNSATNTFSGVFTGSGGIALNGSGTQVLSGNSAGYTGVITVGSGLTLQISNSATVLGTSAGNTVVQSGATVLINSATGSYNQAGAGEIFEISGTGVGGIGALSSNAGGGGIIKGITLNGNASIGGSTRWDIGGGGAGQQAVVNGNGFTLTKTGVNNIWMRATAGGSTFNNLAGLVIDQGVFGVEFGDNAMGSVPVTVNGSGTFSAWTSGPSNIQGATVTLNGGTLDVDASGITFSGPITLTNNSFVSSDGGNMTISGVIAQSGGGYGITKTGGNTLELRGTNTFTGSTVVTGGTLALSGGAALPDNGSVSLTGGGMLLNASETIGTLSGGTSGTLAIGANTLTVNQASNGTLDGTISGSGSLVKNGGGSLVLSGTSGFSGTTLLNSGELVLSAGGAAGSLGSSAITVESGTTLRLATGDASGYAASGVITVRGTIEKGVGNFHDTLNRNIILDGGTLSATDGNTSSGGAYNLFGNTLTTVTGTTSNIHVSGTTLQIRLDGATSPDFNVVAGSQLNVNAVVDGFLGTDTAALNKSGGGTMVLLRDNLYDGVTNINGGTLQVGNGGAAGTLGAGAVNNSGALVIDRSGSYDVTNAIGGTGSVELAGDATVTFSGVSNYTGDTLVSAGTLLLTGQLGGTDVTVDAGATIGGDGSLGGSLHFSAGSNLIFSPTTTLTVNGSDVTFDGFGVANLIGLDGNTPDGTYVLIDGAATVSTANLSNVGYANRFGLGGDRWAYLEIGSLELVVIPEPSSALLGLLGSAFLLRRRRN